MGSFGGDCIKDKLDMVEQYLDAYTTALKNQDYFRLMYIDAFAGSGIINLGRNDKEERQFLEGSAIRAKRVSDRRFDEILLVEKDARRCTELAERMNADEDERIQVLNEDANCFLQSLSRDWKTHRGVLFLDPFATEVEWLTIEEVASFEALDTWILFPTMAVMRLLTRKGVPKEHGSILKRVYGDESWRNLYRPNPQYRLFSGLDDQDERQKGTNALLQTYKNRLRELYGNRFLEDSATLRTPNNTPMFELIFCVGSSRATAIKAAKNIAGYIVKHGRR